MKYYRNSDPETSVMAIDSQTVAALMGKVLECLKKLGPMTSEEVAMELKLDRVTVSPRFRPLCDLGLVVETELRREGRSGRKQIVWAAV